MKLIIINPNSDPAQTKAIDLAAKAFAADAYEVRTVSTPGAPQYIDTYLDAAQALPGMMQLVRDLEDEADAFIIACHCDPNLDVLKEMTDKLVIGIGEASMKVASMLGHKFSVVSGSDRGIPEKEANIHSYGLDNSVASLRCAGPECSDRDMAGKLCWAAERAVREDMAEVVVLATAGQTELAQRLTQRLGVPVLDGVPCALMLAAGLCRLGISVSGIRRYQTQVPL